MTINQQKTTDKFWSDEKGTNVPFNRVTLIEKSKERAAATIAKQALQINKDLAALKKSCIDACEKAYQADLAAGKASLKGGYTLFNFDKSIKVERSLNAAITFDQNIIGAAKDKFDEFFKGATGGVDTMLQEMILDAFSSHKTGKLDVKKVMGILSYRERVDAKKYPAYHEAVNLIEESIRRPESKIYYRIFIKDETNAHQSIELNFSNI